ncbi:MAG TPA: RDD family protein [Caulobacteraceae bacterium]|nr:RDD family protein [Caulobacteraceae bacterium]
MADARPWSRPAEPPPPPKPATSKRTVARRPDEPRRVRQLITPEGVDLKLELADASERAGAFLIDVAVIVTTLILVTILAGYAAQAAGRKSGESVVVIWVLVYFLLRNAYFIGFELHTGAATIGKRVLGLRVATRNGGRLTADAVIARNAMREIEIFLPLTFLFSAPREQVDAWITLAGIVWSGIFLLFPLFNKDRLRVGDFVAGTWVVRAPRRRLSADLAQENTEAMGFIFTAEQVDAYGVMELQVLEDVIRRGDRPTMSAVAKRIRAKIGWTEGRDETDRAFLDAYYTALRRKLEAGLLFGRRRKDKFDR